MKRPLQGPEVLVLTWGLDPARLPSLPPGLAPETWPVDGRAQALASLVLARRGDLCPRVEPAGLPAFRQADLRLYTRGPGQQPPSVVVLAVWVPVRIGWAVRWVGRLPATSGRLRLPPAGGDPTVEFRWRVDTRAGSCAVLTRFGAAAAAPGAAVVERLAAGLRERRLAYLRRGADWTRCGLACESGPAVPVSATVEDGSLLARVLPVLGEAGATALLGAFVLHRRSFSPVRRPTLPERPFPRGAVVHG